MWTCDKCGEHIEDQFDSCWNCAGGGEKVGLPRVGGIKESRLQKLGESLVGFGLPRNLLTRLPAWSDWVPLGLMAVAAPWIAAYVHSELVFVRGFKLYNAEIGGIYFFHDWPPPPPPNLGTALLCASGFGVPAMITFVSLLPFRKSAALRWLAWICSIAIWVWAYFRLEYALH
jgi:hypothetical protein